MKKAVSLILVCTMLLGILPITAFAVSDTVASGVCGDNLTWELDSDGTLKISGEGEMYSYTNSFNSRPPWNNVKLDIKSVVIEDGVTSIGAGMFYGMKLTEIIIPDSITAIGNEAFMGCDNLREIEIPDSVTSIGRLAFRECRSLTEIEIPDGVTRICDGTFYSCTSLTKAVIPDSVTYIEAGAFKSCTSLTDVAIPCGVTVLEEDAFMDCAGITEITLPEGITSIGRMCFYGCTALTDINLPDSLTTIEEYAFYGCSALNKIVIPENINMIKNAVFANCRSLSEVIIPEGITAIGNSAFINCISLGNITIPNSVTIIGGAAFGGCTGLTEIVIPNSVTEIQTGTFSQCTGLRKITLFDSITSIGDNTLYGCTGLTSIEIPPSVTSIGDYALCGCTGLIDIEIPENVAVIGEYAFRDCENLTSVIIPGSVTSMGANAFYGCKSLTAITLSEGITEIGDGAFSKCTALTEIVIPNSVTSIGIGAFSECTSLSEILIPDSVTGVGSGAFSGCTALTRVDLGYNIISIGNNAFYRCTALTDIRIPDSITKIESSVFMDCVSLTEIVIPDSVTSIGDSSFWHCANVTEITIPDSVTEIGGNAFAHCRSLTEIVIPESITHINNSTFANCTGLIRIVIPDSVTSMGEGVFSGCTSLAEITLPDGINTIGREFFRGCLALTEITIPDSVTSIGWEAFRDCESLSKLTIPDGVTYISDRAFCGCNSLAEITIPDGVTSIGDGMFSGCTALSEITISYNVTNIHYKAFEECPNLTICCFSGSYAEGFAIGRGIPISYILGDGSKITLSIQNERGEAITDGYTVNWYEKGSDAVIANGLTLNGAEKGKTYEYEIVLNFDQTFLYCTPERGTTKLGESPLITLKAISEVVVRGRVVDENGNVPDSLSGWAIQYKDGNTGRIEISFSADGSYELTSKALPTVIYAQADGYYKASRVAISANTEDSLIILNDIKLEKLPENKILLNIYKIATISGSKSSLNNFNDIAFNIRNISRDQSIDNFVVEYPYIIINSTSACHGDVIEITAQAEDYADAISTFSLDSNLNGISEITFIENGVFHTSKMVAVNGLYALVFDNLGNYVTRYAPSTAGFYSQAMLSGCYKIVFIEKNQYLNSVKNYASLADYGLKIGVDFEECEIEITQGNVTEISGIYIPQLDVNKLCYTVDDNTMVSISRNEVVVGNFAVVRVKYLIDEKVDFDNETVIVDIPVGMKIIEGSVTLNGKPVVYIIDDNQLKIKTGANDAVLRFYTSAYNVGTYDMSIYLSCDNRGDSIYQPLGTVHLEATVLTMNVPRWTNSATINVGGKAVPKSIVSVYDGTTKVGETTASLSGSWSMSFELQNSYNTSNHLIYAKVTSNDMEMVSASYIVNCDFDSVGVNRVVMINTAHPVGIIEPTEYRTVFDFKNPSSNSDSYSYWPAYPEFTFLIELDRKLNFDGGVTLLVYTEDGGCTTLNTYYDAVADHYIANGIFTSGARPVNVGVEIDDTRSNTLHLSEFGTMIEKYSEYRESSVTMSEQTAELIDAENGIYVYGDKQFAYKAGCQYINEEAVFEKWTAVSLDSGNQIYANTGDYAGGVYAAFAMTVEDSLSVHELKLFMESENLEGDGKFVVFYEYLKEYIQNFNSRAGMRTFHDDTHQVEPGINIDTAIGIIDENYEIASEATDILLDDAFAAAVACMRNRIKRLNDCGTISTMTVAELAQNMLNKAENIHQNAEDSIDALEDMGNLLGLSNKCGFEIAERRFSTFTDIVNHGIMPIGDLTNLKNIDRQMRNTEKSHGLSSSCDGDGIGEIPNNLIQNPVYNYPGFNLKITDDPSGYVYEAVPSNRVEGVKVECYYYDYPLDEFGMPADAKEDIFWDASEYDQLNPLYTDRNGMYAWDVPLGSWLVKYSKEGYYDTDSRNDRAAIDGYLPVPPPQVDVNTAIVSKAAPTVESVNAYNDEIQIIFSQYMQLAGINNESVVIKQGGNIISGALSPSNAEYNYEGTEQFASIFTFIPEKSLSGTVEVEIAGVINYAGTAIAAEYRAEKPVKLKPESLSIGGDAEVQYGESRTIDIQILPAEAGKNLMVNITSSSPSILGVQNASVMTDESGRASIVISGLLPGQSNITFEIDGTDISSVKSFNVTMNKESWSGRCEKVVSDTASGSVIKSGTQITLSTPTEGAEIYYTLDRTCPCIIDSPSRLKYTGPITVTEDVCIIAYAVKDGFEESATSQFSYTVEASLGDGDNSDKTPVKPDDNRENTAVIILIAIAAIAAAVGVGVFTAAKLQKKKKETGTEEH